MAKRAPTTVLEPDQETEATLARPWKVVVHDDPVNLMVYVTRVFMQIFGYAKPKAERHMMEVHRQGRSVVWTGEREKAEVYTMKLLAAQLRATMEQVEA